MRNLEEISFQVGFNKGTGVAIVLLTELMAKGLEGMMLLAEFSSRLADEPYPTLKVQEE